MSSRVEEGQRALALERSIEGELIPRLLVAHRVGPVPPARGAAAGGALADEDLEAFVRLVRALDPVTAETYVRQLLGAGVSAEDVFLELLSPAARRLGQLWERDVCDFLEVTLAVGRMQAVVRRLQELFRGPVAAAPRGRILLAGPPDEQHTLGLLVVAEFFIRDGWTVDVGSPFAGGEPTAPLAEASYDVVGFSISRDASLTWLRRAIDGARRVSRNRELVVLVGGRTFNDDPDRVRQVRADGWAADAREAPLVAGTLF